MRVHLYPGLLNGTIGAIGELRAAADLLAKGYEVFRAISPNTSCDLVAMKNGKCLRIEVRTAYYRFNGEVGFPTWPKDKGRSDHYAAVLPDRVIYQPELDV